MNSNGGVVPDGYYNIEFNLYEGGNGLTAGNPAGSLKWTETYLNNNAKAGIPVQNGYFAVNLGSKTPFTNVDWNSSTLWLSMNVAGSSNSCSQFNTGSCAADGEMVPMRRLTSSPYAMNAGAVGGKSVDQLLQLGQGVQNDTSNSSSIFVNKSGTGNLIQMQNGGQDAFTVTNSGDIQFGNATNHTIDIAPTSETDANGSDLTLNAGAGNGTGVDGSLYLGASNTSTIQVGATDNSDQTIAIGSANTGATNVTIGSSSTATAGTTTIQSKDNTSISTNGTTRAVFDTSGNLTLGNGIASDTPADFRIQGTASSASGVRGGNLTVQGGSATVGDTNGGDLHLSGGAASGAGTTGLVVIDTPTYKATDTQSSAVSVTVDQASVDSFGVIRLAATAEDITFNLPAPSRGAGAAGRIIYVSPTDDSYDFKLRLNTGSTREQLLSLKAGVAASLLWNGTSWVNVGGSTASSSLQATYDNSSNLNGGAELVVSNNETTDGLTIRDSATNPVNNTLLEVQNSDAATLFSVKSNVNQLASNPGAETAGTTSTTFPANTWNASGDAATSRYIAAGNYIHSGRAAVKIDATGAQSGATNTLTKALKPNTSYTVSLSARLESGTANDFFAVAYSSDGNTMDPVCINDVTLSTSDWKKIHCTFTTPADNITNNNAIVIGQYSAAHRVFYVDDLSVTAAGDNLVSDGDVNDSANFATNWSTAGPGTVTLNQDTNVGYNDNTSVAVGIDHGANYAGVRNKLSAAPQIGKSYKVTVHGAADTSFDDFAVRYSPDGGSHFTACTNYSTHSISAQDWSTITCYINTDTTEPTDPYLYFVEQTSTDRMFYLDNISMTLNTETTSRVKVGNSDSDKNGSPTLFTVDKSADAPTADDDADLLGSMYYDTTLGKLQCFQSDGWGTCGDRPDTFITLSPEYANAVMNGTDVGDIESGLCSGSLGINDGSDDQPAICAPNETYNFYHWTSKEVSDQTKSIFVTYQLPDNFKKFVEGSTSLMSRTDSDDATVSYQIYRNQTGDGLTPCGLEVTASNGAEPTWNKTTAEDDADPSKCDFKAGDNIVIRINMTAKNNKNAYVSTLGFTYGTEQ